MTAFEELVSALDEAGLWSDVGDDHQRVLVGALLSGEDVTWTAGGAWRADGEDLADGEVEAWLGRLARTPRASPESRQRRTRGWTAPCSRDCLIP